MAQQPHGSLTKRLLWVVAICMASALATAGSVPWKPGIILTYAVVGFVLHLVVRLKDPNTEGLVRIVVMAGASPFVVRSFFGSVTGWVATVHVSALIGTGIALGFLLADRIRLRAGADEPRTTA